MKGDFRPNALQHLCMISDDGGVIFYSLRDILSFFTVVSVVARDMGISVTSFVIMLNHFHISAEFEDSRQMRMFVTRICRIFVRDYNNVYGLTGRLFHCPFGRSSLLTEKRIRSCIVYHGNNPVEKLACGFAEESRLNFLAYCNNPNPFSEPVVLNRASRSLRSAMRLVSTYLAEGRSLNISLLSTMFERLGDKEARQLADCIVTTYNFIDYARASSYFDGFGNMLLAMHSTTGSDFEMQEEYMKENYRTYFAALGLLSKTEFLRRRPNSFEEFVDYYNMLEVRVRGITHREICRLLHWFPEKGRCCVSDDDYFGEIVS